MFTTVPSDGLVALLRTHQPEAASSVNASTRHAAGTRHAPAKSDIRRSFRMPAASPESLPLWVSLLVFRLENTHYGYAHRRGFGLLTPLAEPGDEHQRDRGEPDHHRPGQHPCPETRGAGVGGGRAVGRAVEDPQ